MNDMVDQAFNKLLDEYAEIIDSPYRFCSKCRRYKPISSIGCWGYRYLCGDCWNELYGDK